MYEAEDASIESRVQQLEVTAAHLVTLSESIDVKLDAILSHLGVGTEGPADTKGGAGKGGMQGMQMGMVNPMVMGGGMMGGGMMGGGMMGGGMMGGGMMGGSAMMTRGGVMMGGGGMGKGGMVQLGGAANNPGDPLGQFVSRWKLDAGAEQMLRKARPHIQEFALSNFSPDPSLPNVNGKFVSYLKNLSTSMVGQGQDNTNGGMVNPAAVPSGDPLSEFVAMWKLDAGAEQMLRQAKPQLQELALANFHPDPNLPNFSGKFVSYLKNLSASPGAVQAAQATVAKFSPY